MSRQLLWIRHARPASDPATPPREWPLAPDSRQAAARLARALGSPAGPVVVVTSDERKAVETAEAVCDALGLAPAEVCAGLGEVQRSWTDGDYRAAAREYLRSGFGPGWEPSDEVLRRVSGALAEHWRPRARPSPSATASR